MRIGEVKEDMRERPTARILLLDPDDRILLVRGRLLSAPAGAGAWFTVGGGIEPGESLAEAAAREIVEETGFTDAVLGPVVWVREGPMEFYPGQLTLIRETYVLARCQGGEPSRMGWTALEREIMDDMRWWTVGDMRASTEAVHPAGLADLLTGLLAEGAPATPTRLPWPSPAV